MSPMEKRALPILQLMNPRLCIASVCLHLFLLAKASQYLLFGILIIYLGWDFRNNDSKFSIMWSVTRK